MDVTIIGAGNMGRGIRHRMVSGGHDVTIVDRDPQEAERLAEELRSAAEGGAQRSKRRSQERSRAARWLSSRCTIRGTSRSSGI
jgi:3-hydroxyacyl-CoA dehydrogenase